MTDADYGAVGTVVRSGLIAGGTVLVSKGYFSADFLNDVVGAAMIVGPVVWGIINKYILHGKINDAKAGI